MSWSFSLPIDRASSGESEISYRMRLRRLATHPLAMTVAVIFFAALVCLTFVAYLVAGLGGEATRILFALYVVLGTFMYGAALVWGNIEQRRSRRAEAAPELVLERRGDQLVVSNVGSGPAVDARITVSVDGERIHDELHPVLRPGKALSVASEVIEDDTDFSLYVWSATQLTDVDYRVDRTYSGATLLA